MATFTVIIKNGKPYLRMVCGCIEQDMMIYGKTTDHPYVKYMSGYLGKLELEEDMKAQLKEIMAA